MIRFADVSREYTDGAGRKREVLSSVDLEIGPGEFVALTGRSGAGKSTLLHIAAGLDRAYTGRVTVDDMDLARLSASGLARLRNQHFGFVFQAFHLVAHWTVAENVALPDAFSQCTGTERDRRQRANEVLAAVGLEERSANSPRQLSGGERQRVAIARALFGRPKVLLCDEPTGHLDVATTSEILSLLQRVNSQGTTVVAVTHDEAVANAAHRRLRLVQGKVSE